jgi:heterodisulfide reductase subunit C
MTPTRIPSLRSVVLAETGQDLRRCQGCLDCDAIPAEDTDISLGSLIQLALLNDEEILTSRTLWSDSILESAHSACAKNLDLAQIILVFRREALKRGLREYSS